MNNLNDQQMSAVMCEENKILCLAGAGTGKTTCMLARISRLVETGVTPASILVLTFTNAAAFEMKDRYRRQSYDAGGTMPEFCTFHAFCYHVLATNSGVRAKLGFTATPAIAEDKETKRILKEAGSITNIKYSIESLSKKVHRTVKEQYDYEMLQKAATTLMRKYNLITFDQLSSKICELFKTDDPQIQMYKRRYKYIFVDEFQDTDPIQYEFIKSFKTAKLFVVGDALQAIYAFRGADSSIIKSLSIDSEWHTIKLHLNYRSPRTICDFANYHSKYADENFRVSIESGKQEEGSPVVCKNTSDLYQNGLYKNNVDACISDLKLHSGSTAILSRTNKEVKAIQDYFDADGIAYRTHKKDDTVKHLLASIGDNTYLVEWLASLLNSDMYVQYIRLSTLKQLVESAYDIVDFVKDFGHVYVVADKMNLVRTLRRICRENNRTIIDRCQDILDILDCKYMHVDESKCTTMKAAVDHMIEIYDTLSESPGSDVYIGTIHSVKGLEFDNVYVLGVDGPTFRLIDEENKNLYYVAITRAKKHLMVFEKEQK